MKRLSTPKQEPQKETVNNATKATPPQKAGRRTRRQRDEEELQDEEEDKEEALSPSLKKRNKNIQENRAMVVNLDSVCFL